MTSLSRYLFVLVCLVVLTRCRLVTVVLCWVPLILTVCYLIFSNSLTNNSQVLFVYSNFKILILFENLFWIRSLLYYKAAVSFAAPFAAVKAIQIKKFFHGVNVGEDISTTRDAPENSLAALELVSSLRHVLLRCFTNVLHFFYAQGKTSVDFLHALLPFTSFETGSYPSHPSRRG